VRPGQDQLVVSSRTGAGLDELRSAVAQRLAGRDAHVGELLGSTAARCRDSLRAAGEAVQRSLALIDAAAGDELIAVELRAALEQTGQVAGQATTDDLLDRIFSRFCIGK
jgi:tRNA modification GTPase